MKKLPGNLCLRKNCSGVFILLMMGTFICGCNRGNNEVKSAEEKKVFKGSKPPPEIQKQIDETMRQQRAGGPPPR